MGLINKLTGRSEEEYKQDSIYKDDTKVEELKTDMDSLSKSVESAKDAVSDAIEKLNNVKGVDRIGSFNVAPINKSFDELNRAIEQMSSAIVNKAESINEYSKATGGEKILASLGGIGVSLLAGGVGGVENLLDGSVSVVGIGLDLIGLDGAADWLSKNLVEPDVSGSISHKYYNSALGRKCAWTEDSGIARGLEFAGEVGVSMLIGGGVVNMAGKRLAVNSASKLANLALKANTAKHYISGISALEGMGATVENRLRAGDTFQEASAKGVRTGAITGAATYGFLGVLGKVTSPAVKELRPVKAVGDKLKLAGDDTAFWASRIGSNTDEVVGEAAEKIGKGSADDIAETAERQVSDKADNIFTRIKNKITGETDELTPTIGKNGKMKLKGNKDKFWKAYHNGAEEAAEETAEKAGRETAEGVAAKTGKETAEEVATKADDVLKGGKKYTVVNQQKPSLKPNATYKGSPKKLAGSGVADDLGEGASKELSPWEMRHGKGTDPLAHAGDQGSPAEILYGKGANQADDVIAKADGIADKADDVLKGSGKAEKYKVDLKRKTRKTVIEGPDGKKAVVETRTGPRKVIEVPSPDEAVVAGAREAAEGAATKRGILDSINEAIQTGSENPGLAGAALAAPAAFRVRNVHPDYDLDNIDPLNIEIGPGSEEPGTQQPASTTVEPPTTEPPTGPDPGGGGGGGGGGGHDPITTEPPTTQPRTTEPSTTEPSTTEPVTTEIPTTEEPTSPTDVPPTEDITTTPEPPVTTTQPTDPGPGGQVPQDEPYHQGGGYSEDTGYSDDWSQEPTEDPSIIDDPVGSEDDFVDPSNSIDSIIKGGSKVTKIPSSKSEISSGSSGSAVIPVIAGLSAAAAAGIGAKAYMDRKNNSDNGEDEDFEAEEWTGEDNLDIDYNDGVQEEQYLDDESDYGTTEESEEKYDARSNDELADLQ